MDMRTQGKITLQVNTSGIFMPKGVFGVSYWSSRRRFEGAVAEVHECAVPGCTGIGNEGFRGGCSLFEHYHFSWKGGTRKDGTRKMRAT